MSNRPISIELLARKRKEEEDARAKPVFLTKEQRSQLALERRRQEVAQTRQVSSSVAHHQSQLGDQELDEIRKRYMGVARETAHQDQKLIKKNQMERKFRFEWDDAEDTGASYSATQSKLMFGRGRFGGMDDDIDGSMKQRKRSRWDGVEWRDKPLEEMTPRDWRIFREEFRITTKGGGIPFPIRFWSEETRISPEIQTILKQLGYAEPTPIQRQSIAIGLTQRDLIGVAETGSGKTVAFLIPMLEFIRKLPQSSNSSGPYAIVLVPTRELAQQIERETIKFANSFGFRTVSIVGGRSIEEQAFVIQKGVEIVIATPGRLRDCIERRILVLNQCSYIVMDEADQMVDMGFEEDVNYVLDSLPVIQKPGTETKDQHSGYYRQTIMFSATMAPSIESIAKRFLSNPAVITVASLNAIENIKQQIEMIAEERKSLRLIDLLDEGWGPPIIVFVNMKSQTELIARLLEEHDYRVAVLHGGKSQESREAAIASLRRGDKHVLVATDVAARGLDIPDVSLVVNYDMAKNIEEYTHRIGRTGRAGKSGTSVTFLTSGDTDTFFDLRKMLQNSSSAIPAELARHEASKIRPGLKLGPGQPSS